MNSYRDIKQEFKCPLLLIFIVLFNLFFHARAWCDDRGGEELRLYIDRGRQDLREENYEEALQSFQKAREIAPDSSLAAYLLGITYKLTEDYSNALVHLEDAVRLRPGVKEALFELAGVYYHLDRFEDSLAMIESAEAASGVSDRTAFLKGMALMKLGRYQEAVESFTTARDLNPELRQPADFHIAMALIKEGKAGEAGDLLHEVVVADPNTELAAIANRHIEALKQRAEKKKTPALSAGLSFQYDDNVILKPSDQTAAAGITGEQDTRYVATFSAGHTVYADGPLSLKARYSFYMSDHTNLGTHDVMSHTIIFVPSYAMKRVVAGLLISNNYTLVDDDRYLDTVTLSPTLTIVAGRNQTVRAALAFRKKEFLRPPLHPEEDRDARDYSLRLSYNIFYARNRGLVGIVYQLNQEDTDGRNWDNRGNMLLLNAVVPVKDRFLISASAEIFYQLYRNENTNFRVRRRDITYTFSALMGCALSKRLRVELRYSHIRDDSNIAVYDYRKNVTGIWILGAY